MSHRKVVKIGGSNLKKIEDISRIAEIIVDYKPEPVVVVSAFYGITDKLIKVIDEILDSPHTAGQLIDEIKQLKIEYILELIDKDELRIQTFNLLESALNELSGLLMQISRDQIISPAEKDLILSYGERLSAIIVCAAINSVKEISHLAFPETIGLYTDEVFGNASVDLFKSKAKLKNVFQSDIIYVVPGFYGISTNGRVCLLGRGGTDYSAAAIAYCLDALSLDIWKDVDGFMTGDPKHVENPWQINHLSYLEAAELAYFGAGILHPRTVEPLQLKNIPIRIFNVEKDNAFSKPQTIIDEKISINPKVIKSLTFENQIGILNIKGPGVGYIPGILSEITKVLSNHLINISSVITSQISINLLIKTGEIEKAKLLIESLNIQPITDIGLNKEVSLIAVVGNGMTKAPGIAAKVFSTIANEGINIILSSLGASDVVSYFIVGKSDAKRAVSKLHEALFNEKAVEMLSLA